MMVPSDLVVGEEEEEEDGDTLENIDKTDVEDEEDDVIDFDFLKLHLVHRMKGGKKGGRNC